MPANFHNDEGQASSSLGQAKAVEINIFCVFTRSMNTIGLMATLKARLTLHSVVLVIIAICSVETSAGAEKFPVQARLFAGMTSTDPSGLNEELRAQGIKEFKSIPKYGAEATFALNPMLDVGFRYEKRYLSNSEEAPISPSTSSASLDQDSVLLVARVPLVKKSYFQFDVFGGVGGSNTTLKVKTASQDGELTKRESGDWFASLRTSFGASVAVGFKKVYLVVEGGQESNKVDSFKRSGNVSSNIQSMDLSGSYVTIGLMFDTNASKN